MDTRQFFLYRHASAHEGSTELLFNDTDEHIRSRPHPSVNSIVWLFWHIARTEDLAINRFVGDRNQVLDDEEWMPRLGIYRRDIGTGMTYAEVDDLSEQVNLEALRAYWGSVGRRTVAVVTELTPDDLDRVNEGAHVRRVVFDEGAIQGEHREAAVGIWSGLTWGKALAYLGLTHSFGHIGEMEIIRGMWGHPGSWSPRAQNVPVAAANP
jgi:hypothetical protein